MKGLLRVSIFLGLTLTIMPLAMAQGSQVAGTQCWINGKLVGGFPPGYHCPGTSSGQQPQQSGGSSSVLCFIMPLCHWTPADNAAADAAAAAKAKAEAEAATAAATAAAAERQRQLEIERESQQDIDGQIDAQIARHKEAAKLREEELERKKQEALRDMGVTGDAASFGLKDDALDASAPSPPKDAEKESTQLGPKATAQITMQNRTRWSLSLYIDGAFGCGPVMGIGNFPNSPGMFCTSSVAPGPHRLEARKSDGDNPAAVKTEPMTIGDGSSSTWPVP